MNKEAWEYPVHQLIRERWSPRSFDARFIPTGDLNSVLEAARWAPSCYNEQPWVFLVAQRESTDTFANVLSCLVEGNQLWARNASCLILSFAKSDFQHNGKLNRHAWHDVGLAVAQMTLEATSRGIAVHQMAGIQRERIVEIFHVPEGFEPVTGIALGYQDSADKLPPALALKETAERTRKPFANVVRYTGWPDAGSASNQE